MGHLQFIDFSTGEYCLVPIKVGGIHHFTYLILAGCQSWEIAK